MSILKKSNEKITLMLLSNKKSHVRKIHFPAHWKKPLIYMSIALAVFFFGTATHYFFLLNKLSNYNKMQNQNMFLAKQVGNLESKISSLESLVTQVNELSAKLSIMAGVSSSSAKRLSLGAQPNSLDDAFVADIPPAKEWDNEEVFKKLNAKLDLNKEALSMERLTLEEVYNVLQDQSSLLASTPSIKPTDGWITSGFGLRVSPWTGKKQRHEGIDIAARYGTEVAAPADGVVIFAGLKGGFGKTIVINHGYSIMTKYGHNSKIFVETGQKVKRGDTIAAIGNTGRSTGPHLHYEIIKNNKHIDPLDYILD